MRILVLPGHFECRHEPDLRLLAKYKDRVSVSILDQYVPEHNGHHHDDLGRRPTAGEVCRVKHLRSTTICRTHNDLRENLGIDE